MLSPVELSVYIHSVNNPFLHHELLGEACMPCMVSLLMERCYQSIPNGVLTAHMGHSCYTDQFYWRQHEVHLLIVHRQCSSSTELLAAWMEWWNMWSSYVYIQGCAIFDFGRSWGVKGRHLNQRQPHLTGRLGAWRGVLQCIAVHIQSPHETPNLLIAACFVPFKLHVCAHSIKQLWSSSSSQCGMETDFWCV